MADNEFHCIYCGKPLVKYRDSYFSGIICGQHNAKMCMECASGDGAKYLDGDYYGRGNNRKEKPEKKPLLCPEVKDMLWCILAAFVFWVAVAVYFVFIR